MRAVLILSVFFFAVPVFAVTYEWTDDAGTVNFTEDLGSVPKKYQKKVKVLGGEESTPEITDIENNSAGKTTSDEGKGKGEAKETARKPAVYGGKSETAWKNDYGKLSADVKASEDQLNQLNSRLSDSGKMSRSEYLSIQYTIKNTESKLNDQRKKLEAFKASADKEGVPSSLFE